MTSPQFRLDETPTAEVERQEAVHAPLADAVRDLLATAMETGAPPEVLEQAGGEVRRTDMTLA